MIRPLQYCLLAIAATGLVSTAAPADIIQLDWVADGAQENPPVTTAGAGYGVIYVDDQTGEFSLQGAFVGLNGSVTAAHIHGPADVGQNAGVIVSLSATGTDSGCVTGSGTLSDADLGSLLTGMTYVNIHSTLHGGGEIRGQIFTSTDDIATLAFNADGAQEVPPVDSDGSADGFVVINNDSGDFAFCADFQNLNSNVSVAHIHGPADVGQGGGVLESLVVQGGTSGIVAGAENLDAATTAAAADDMTYLNIHSTTSPAGEIRGQLWNLMQSAPTPGTAGTVNTLAAEAATPGNTIYFVYSLALGSTNVPGCGGVSVDINSPKVAGSASAGVDGTASISSFVPGAASGLTVHVQSVEIESCTVSNLVSYTFP